MNDNTFKNVKMVSNILTFSVLMFIILVMLNMFFWDIAIIPTACIVVSIFSMIVTTVIMRENRKRWRKSHEEFMASMAGAADGWED